MKKLIVSIFTLFVGVLSIAQAPQKISYQALVRDAEDKLVSEQAVGMKISILQGELNVNINGQVLNTAVYVETHQPTTNSNGVVYVEIGGGTSELGNLSTIEWGDGPYFIYVEFDISGGTNYTINGVSQLLSVPYALHANTADSLTADIIENQTLADVLVKGNEANTQIKNVTTPTEDKDAVNKLYADSLGTKIADLEKMLMDAGLYKVQDGSGNWYETVTIGNQVWLKQNLRTTKYNDGEDIPLVTDSAAWANLNTPGYCWYDNDKSTFFNNNYGALYNWYVVETDKLCPVGFHVPSLNDFNDLMSFTGGDQNSIGHKIKSTNGEWSTSRATDEFGFSMLPGGLRDESKFSNIDFLAYQWLSVSTGSSSDNAFLVIESSSIMPLTYRNKQNGLSVRCLKD